MPLNNMPLFLIGCGVFGIGLGLYWRKKNQQETFPFLPCVTLAWGVACLEFF
jgi:hypothetical protein